MQSETPVIDQIQETICRLEAELEQLESTKKIRQKELQQNKRALKILADSRRDSRAE